MAASPLQFTFLGTGTSQGVPVIGCQCEVCTSEDPRDQRLRTAGLLSLGNTNVCIDAGPDFRQQMLRAGVSHLEAILITHEHNDHVVGLDDVRPFNFMARRDMPIYATPAVQSEIRSRFAYAFDEEPYPGAPRLRLENLDKDVPLTIGELHIQPIEVIHGAMPVLGFRVGKFAYITDMKTIREEEFQKLAGIEILVVNALHHAPHYSHLNLEEALEFIQRVQPQQSYLIHCSHRMGKFEDVNPALPQGVQLAWDGLTISVPAGG